jgi:hypothetical protein
LSFPVRLVGLDTNPGPKLHNHPIQPVSVSFHSIYQEKEWIDPIHQILLS